MNSEDGPSTTQWLLTIWVRLLGTLVLMVGIGAAVLVIIEAWYLYREPHRIERFAIAVEEGSNLDKFFGPVIGGSGSLETEPADPESLSIPRAMASTRSPADSLRLSYFVTWLVALGLLLVLSIIAMSAITTGGQLALYETPAARMRREMRKELRRRDRQAAA